ncbi:hypothetical protein SAY86_006713 [Trapa natans]|uniref:RRM domain-containing protein n=1 Tax=Trapa natans TaxID=22666 RepID=A0AAN7LCM8_TRANT|nr:hypothetical protein SAY86_006713 [Trapa natans]
MGLEVCIVTVKIEVQHHSGAATNEPTGLPASGSGGVSPCVSTSLYIRNLDFDVSNSQLYDLFNQIGQVVSVRVCWDLTTRQPLDYGHANYSNLRM